MFIIYFLKILMKVNSVSLIDEFQLMISMSSTINPTKLDFLTNVFFWKKTRLSYNNLKTPLGASISTYVQGYKIDEFFLGNHLGFIFSSFRIFSASKLELIRHQSYFFKSILLCGAFIKVLFEQIRLMNYEPISQKQRSSDIRNFYIFMKLLIKTNSRLMANDILPLLVSGKCFKNFLFMFQI